MFCTSKPIFFSLPVAVKSSLLRLHVSDEFCWASFVAEPWVYVEREGGATFGWKRGHFCKQVLSPTEVYLYVTVFRKRMGGVVTKTEKY